MSDATITQIPAPRVPLIDIRTGLVSREWFRFFNNIYVITGGATEGVIPISSGGTGATSAAQARANLQAGTVSRVRGEGIINGLSLSGNITTEGFLTLSGSVANVDLTTQTIGTLDIDTRTTGTIDIDTRTTGTIDIDTRTTGTIDIDTRTTGVLPVDRGGTGVACTGIRTETSDFSVADDDLYLINNKSGSACIVTFPSASVWPGRALHFKNTQAQALDSASSNVVPITGGAAGTSILGATSGAWATVVSDGTDWVVMATG